MHETETGWEDITTSLDTATNIICGSTTSFSWFVIVEPSNQPPIADAGGPYTVIEGYLVTLDGVGSSDPDQPAGTLIYEWDFDGDGQYDDAVGIDPSFSAANLEGPGSVIVELRVTDNNGESDTNSAVVTLENMSPAVVAGSEQTVNEGELVELDPAIFSDFGTLDTHISTIDWGDGSPVEAGTLKVNTETGNELGRYMLAPHNGDPSRTTVDLDGSCWVGVREAGTVVKIGLYEAGQWIDRNGDSICQTSLDTNSDGDITGSELLPWGQDECVLYEIVLISGHEGTYAPGTYSGPYDYDYWGTAPRGLAVDASNNLWAGTWSSMKYYYIDGTTGAILRVVSTPLPAYGAVIDKNGILWSAGSTHNCLLRLDPATGATSTLCMEHVVYGLGVDYLGHLFVSGRYPASLSRIDTVTGTIEWTKDGPAEARGVVCTSDNDVWVAGTSRNEVVRYNNEGTKKTTIIVGQGPTGVAVDAAGKIWACNLYDDTIVRIDPATDTVDLTKSILGSDGHYSYSDMTGIVARTITTKIGTWTVVYDSGTTDTSWGTVSWNSYEPDGTSAIVSVRSSNDSVWSAPETAENGVALTLTPDGPYLEIKTTLKITSGEMSPILYDLTVFPECDPIKIESLYADPLLVQIGDPIYFMANLTGCFPTYGEWNFGDGTYDAPYPYEAMHSYSEAGVYTVELDATDGQSSDHAEILVVVYDPSAGFVTGGGWVDSPFNENYLYMTVGGRANFGCVSKYKKGASVPTGQTEFVFHTAGLNFHSSTYDWLVVNQNDSNAQFKGSGTINGEGDYEFMLWAEDDEPDTFRIKIWYEAEGEVVVYDNGSAQPIGGGRIIIHSGK